MEEKKLFTSESVSMGHPDKVADQISDSILDAMLEQDPKSRVAVETMVTTGLVVIAGEVTTQAHVDITQVVRNTIKEIGYTDCAMGFDFNTCAVVICLDKQSPDISQGVSEGKGLHTEQGAGDQGLMFGYASDETPELMPLPIQLAHRLMEELSQLREKGQLSYLRPDAKSQVTVEYDGSMPVRVHTVVLSTQHSPDIEYEKLREDMIEKVIRKVIDSKYLDENTIYHINPTGRFVVGGPMGDCGLTGRKIIVDTYGGRGCHGGGAFSGKDPSKVDRSACYAARYVAKNVVAAGLSKRCEVQLSYAIGVAEPISIFVDTDGTGIIPDSEIVKIIKDKFSLNPKGIIESLNLLRPIYKETARHGHFGRSEESFTWEKIDKAKELQEVVKQLNVVKA